jgi:hypothetical protein
MPGNDDLLAQLRLYRDLTRRRDVLIRRAARSGRSRRQIAQASGLSLRRVKELLPGGDHRTPYASVSLDD